ADPEEGVRRAVLDLLHQILPFPEQLAQPAPFCDCPGRIAPVLESIVVRRGLLLVPTARPPAWTTPPCRTRPQKLGGCRYPYSRPIVKIGDVGAQCNGCSHKHRWPINEFIAQHQPWTTVVELARRWKCSRCGSRDVVPFAIGR